MSIQGISNTYNPIKQIDEKSQGVTKTSDYAFAGVLEAAKDLLQATNEADKVTTELTYDFMTGKNENIHGLMVAQEKSSILLQFTMQVRNNVLEAYREIMRIPV